MREKKFYVLVLFVLISIGKLYRVEAQNIELGAIVPDSVINEEERKIHRGDNLQSFALLPNVTIPIRQNIQDTVTTGNYNFRYPESRSLAIGYLGNINSPWISFLYFDRPIINDDFIFTNGFDKMLWTQNNIRWYDTKVPFSLLRYNKNFDSQNDESVLSGKIGSNFTKRANVTVDFNYINSNGFYTANRSKTVDYGISAYYKGERYKAYAFIGNNNFVQSENGGITDYRYISDPLQFSNGRIDISSREVPVKIPEGALYNRIINGLGYLSHSYSFGYWSTDIRIHKDENNKYKTLEDIISSHSKEKIDSIKMDTIRTFVSFMDVSHTFKLNKQFHRMISRNNNIDWSEIFGQAYINKTLVNESDPAQGYRVLPNDTMNLVQLSNTFALTVNEGFRPWVKFGLSAYARMENSFVSNIDSISGTYRNNDSFNSVFVGGRMDKNKGLGLKFNISGEIGVLGRSLGAININGLVHSTFDLWEEKVNLTLQGSLVNMPVPYFTEHYHSTFGYWDKNFSFYRKAHIGGKINFDRIGLTLETNTATLNNTVYWNSNGTPEQYSGVIQILSFRASETIQLFQWLNILADVVYQGNTNNNIIPLPILSARFNVYSDFYLARVLRTQIGLDSYWHTSFNSPVWSPSTMQFQNQQSGTVGGKTPIIIAYANFRLKQGKFFVKMFNLGELLFDPDRISLYNYPYNPPHIEAGLVVDLFN